MTQNLRETVEIKAKALVKSLIKGPGLFLFISSTKTLAITLVRVLASSVEDIVKVVSLFH